MITVKVARENTDGSKVHVRVTAKDIATAARLVPGSVVFPIDPEEYFRGSGPEDFYSVDEIEAS